MLARAEKQANVARHFVIGESTVHSIKKGKDNILKCYNDSSVSSRSVIKHVRRTTPERGKIKKLLTIYIDEQASKNICADSNVLRETAKGKILHLHHNDV